MAFFKTDKISDDENEALKKAAEKDNRSRQKYLENLIQQHAQKLIKKGE